MKNHKVEKGCILAALLFVLLWIGGSFPVNAKETGRGRVLFISSYSYAWETIPQQIEGNVSAIHEQTQKLKFLI